MDCRLSCLVEIDAGAITNQTTSATLISSVRQKSTITGVKLKAFHLITLVSSLCIYNAFQCWLLVPRLNRN